jgi:hypothetical protein
LLTARRSVARSAWSSATAWNCTMGCLDWSQGYGFFWGGVWPSCDKGKGYAAAAKSTFGCDSAALSPVARRCTAHLCCLLHLVHPALDDVRVVGHQVHRAAQHARRHDGAAGRKRWPDAQGARSAQCEPAAPSRLPSAPTPGVQPQKRPPRAPGPGPAHLLSTTACLR